MQPYPLQQLLGSFRQLTEDIVLFLPRTSDLRQLATETEDSKKIKAIHYCMEGASKVFLHVPNPVSYGFLTSPVGHVCLFWLVTDCLWRK